MLYTVQQLLDRLQSCDECQRIEIKEAKAALGKSALQTISAFSNEPNLEGGYLILGLKRGEDINGGRYSIVGVDDPDKIQCEIASLCGSAFNLLIRPEIRVESISGRALVVVFIPEAFTRDKPVFIQAEGIEKGTYRRIGSTDHRCTAEDLDLLYQLRRQQAYESEVFPNASWDDISPEAVTEYRRLRAHIDPSAGELAFSDQQLLIALGASVKKENKVVPTIGGLLLFGSKVSLRRTMPMAARIDYILVEGSEWVQNPSERYHSIEYREALVTAMPRIHAQIMGDLPTRFSLMTGALQRNDIPSIPRDVIRETLANALMHRDYRVNQPIQIIRYSNRIEVHNPGYSLKAFDELGQAGSLTRNATIAAVFHELKFAETKGTGIATMRRLMKEAGLSTPPLIETDRDNNKFSLLLLPHHLLDKEELQWLSQFKDFRLSESDARALVLARNVGAITNQDYRQINGTDTLASSTALRRLRDSGLLEMKGAGNGTYYKPASLMLGIEEKASEHSHDKNQSPHTSTICEGSTPHTKTICEGSTSHTNSEIKGLVAIPKEFPPLPSKLIQKLTYPGRRTKKGEINEIIKELCSLGTLQLSQLARILDRDPRHLRDRYLSKMIKTGELVYLYPEQPAHPQQAYKTPRLET